MLKNDYLCIGKIINTRGIGGELKIESWCDYPEKFYEIENIFLNINDSPLEIVDLRVHKSHVLMRIKDVNSIDEAKKLINKCLYALKNEIPIEKDSYFIEEIKGFKVFDAKSLECYGILSDVLNTGANDIYSVIDFKGKEYLVPIIKGTVSDISLENSKIFINPISGIFDE